MKPSRSPDWAALPANCLELVFRHLQTAPPVVDPLSPFAATHVFPLTDRLNCRQVCRSWNAVPVAKLAVAELQTTPSPGSILRLLSKAGSGLEELWLDDAPLNGSSNEQTSERTMSMLQSAALYSPRLRRLTFTADSLVPGDWGAALLPMLGFRQLAYLNLSLQDVESAGVLDGSPLAQLPELWTLVFESNCSGVAALLFKPGAPPPALRRLVVHASQATCHLYCAWGALSRLTSLSLRDVAFGQQCPLRAPASLRVLGLIDTPAGAESFGELQHLEACDVPVETLLLLSAAFGSLHDVTCRGCQVLSSYLNNLRRLCLTLRSMGQVRRLLVHVPDARLGRQAASLEVGALMQQQLPHCTIEFLSA